MLYSAHGERGQEETGTTPHSPTLHKTKENEKATENASPFFEKLKRLYFPELL